MASRSVWGASSPIFFDFDALSDIEVTTGGSDLSIATPGVTVNLVTRRGTNELWARPGLYTGGAGWDTGRGGRSALERRSGSGGLRAQYDYLGQPFVNRSVENLEKTVGASGMPSSTPVPSTAKLTSRTPISTGLPRIHRSISPWNPAEQLRPGVFRRGLGVSRPALRVVLLSYVPASSTDLPSGSTSRPIDEMRVWRHSFESHRQAPARIRPQSWPRESSVGYWVRWRAVDGEVEPASRAGRTSLLRANLYDVFLGTRSRPAT